MVELCGQGSVWREPRHAIALRVAQQLFTGPGFSKARSDDANRERVGEIDTRHISRSVADQ
jgi:hypothetical protein